MAGAVEILCPDPLLRAWQNEATHGLPGRSEVLPVTGRAGGCQQRGGIGAGLVEDGGDLGQRGKTLAGPLVYAGLPLAAFPAMRYVGWPDGAAGCPSSPAGRVLSGPLGDVEVEGPDCD